MSNQEYEAMMNAIARKRIINRKIEERERKRMNRELIIGVPLITTAFVLWTYLIASFPV